MCGSSSRTSVVLPARLPAAPAVTLIAELRAQGCSLNELARRTGTDRRVLQRLAGRRWLTPALADRLAVATGRHPCQVWPEWFGAVVPSPARSGSSPSVGAPSLRR